MVYVQLAKDWTDGEGTAHSAGDMVEVDAGTLAELESAGIVAGEGGGESTAWNGPDESTTAGAGTDAWPGPTGGEGESWPGPTA